MPEAASLADRVLAGDLRALARAISLVEDEAPDAARLDGRAVSRAPAAPGRSASPGRPAPARARWSISSRARCAPAARRVGIIAVDPTSPFTGGAILGDRVRMQAHAGDAGVFIRSMATRGHLGGLARATADAALVLDAAGRDCVIIETVGVGQDEVDIVRTADVCVVVLVPGTGDDVQALKAGIMEIADIFVVNKADREGADRMVAAVESDAGACSRRTRAAWRRRCCKTEATRGVGVPELLARPSTGSARGAATSVDRRRRDARRVSTARAADVGLPRSGRAVAGRRRARAAWPADGRARSSIPTPPLAGLARRGDAAR